MLAQVSHRRIEAGVGAQVGLRPLPLVADERAGCSLSGDTAVLTGEVDYKGRSYTEFTTENVRHLL